MNIAEYFQDLNDDQKAAFAEDAGSSVGYLSVHLLGSKVRKRPKNDMIIRLTKAAKGVFSLQDVIDYFLVQPVLKMAAELESSPHQAKAGEVGLEMKRFDTPNQAAVLRRVVGRDCEQMQVGGGV
jgi:hypothetical protein